jgi:hypothetical protein
MAGFVADGYDRVKVVLDAEYSHALSKLEEKLRNAGEDRHLAMSIRQEIAECRKKYDVRLEQLRNSLY